MRVGVLALQGDFSEHQTVLQKLGADVCQVRLPEHLSGLDGLILPGGELTTIGKLAVAYGLIDPLREFGRNHAIWGTCAGAIFMSKDIHRSQPLLELMDITVSRNAFGRQVDSFEIDLQIELGSHKNGNARPYHAVFIRAPLIEEVRGDARALARLPDGRIVAALQGRLMATSFHPELTDDDRFHRFFLELSS